MNFRKPSSYSLDERLKNVEERVVKLDDRLSNTENELGNVREWMKEMDSTMKTFSEDVDTIKKTIISSSSSKNWMIATIVCFSLFASRILFF